MFGTSFLSSNLAFWCDTILQRVFVSGAEKGVYRSGDTAAVIVSLAERSHNENKASKTKRSVAIVAVSMGLKRKDLLQIPFKILMTFVLFYKAEKLLQ